MSDKPDDTYTVGWRLRFNLSGGRHKDVYVYSADQTHAIARGRDEMNQGNDSPFPERTPLTEKDCQRLGLKPGETKVL